MPIGPPDAKKLAFYFSLAQIGLEMVAPIAVGVVLDHQLGWKPWGTVVGALFGLVAGLGHLIVMLNQQPRDRDEP